MFVCCSLCKVSCDVILYNIDWSRKMAVHCMAYPDKAAAPERDESLFPADSTLVETGAVIYVAVGDWPILKHTGSAVFPSVSTRWRLCALRQPRADLGPTNRPTSRADTQAGKADEPLHYVPSKNPPPPHTHTPTHLSLSHQLIFMHV